MSGSFQVEWEWTQEVGFTFAHDVPGGLSINTRSDLEVIAAVEREKVRQQIEEERAN